MTAALALIVVAVAVGVAVLYNGLVRTRLRVREAWAAIDVQLQRRASLVPNLVEAVRAYAAYERDTLTRIVEARHALTTAGGPRQAATADQDLTGVLHQLFALSERYPELKASERFMQLQRDLQDTENKVAYARTYYNGAVETYNTRAESFPGLLAARPFGFAPAEFFSTDDEARRAVGVDVAGTTSAR